MLVDKSDFCAGASAASSRMIHGGLRYLEFGEFRLVKESLKERNLLLQNAPHYVGPLPTTIPVLSWFSGAASSIKRFLRVGGNRPAHRGALMVKTGLTFYDVFTRKTRLMPRHKFTSRAEALAKRPALDPNIIGTATYHDAWISYPERLCLELLLDGEELFPQARAINYVSLQSGAGDMVSLRDELSGDVLRVRPQAVVNATGAWIDFANRALTHETKMIGGTKGSHLVLDNPDLYEALQGEMIYYETDDGRVSVALPWLGKALIGSTDIRIDNPDEVRCDDDEIKYILDAIRAVFPGLQVDRSDVVSHFCGVRPLKYSDASATVQVSRDHLCSRIEPTAGVRFPVYALIGGKWTTFRAFAEQVTDRLLEHLGQTRCRGSHSLAIGGGKDFPTSEQARRQWVDRLQDQTGLDDGRLAALLARYGSRAEQVAQFIVVEPVVEPVGEPVGESDQPLRHHQAYSRREIEFIIRHERVVHLDDLLLRRTAIALLGELNGELLEELAEIMAELHQWSAEESREQTQRTLGILRERHGVDIELPV